MTGTNVHITATKVFKAVIQVILLWTLIYKQESEDCDHWSKKSAVFFYLKHAIKKYKLASSCDNI